MRRFRNILAVVSAKQFDPSVVERAASLALMNRGSLSVAVLVPESVFHPFWRRVRSEDLSLEGVLLDGVSQRIRPALRPLQLAGLDVTIGVVRGTSFVGVIQDVLKNQRDLVMVSAGPGGDTRHVDSMVLHLIRKCPCPVWALRSTPAEPMSKVLLAVDVTRQADTDKALNTQLLEMASSMAALENGELMVAHAWEVPGESLLDSALAKVTEEEVQAYAQEIGEERRMLLDAYVASAPNHDAVPITPVLRRGEPGWVITNLVLRGEVDLLVMGSVHRIRLRGFFIGNTAEHILLRVPCSVMTVKPQGFVSPIEVDDAVEGIQWIALFDDAVSSGGMS